MQLRRRLLTAASYLLEGLGYVELQDGYAAEGLVDRGSCVQRFEFDRRKNPKNGELLAIYGRCCHLVELSLRTDDTAALAMLTDHVYCLVKCQTDGGHPGSPDAYWDKNAFVDVQSAARAARKFWGVEQIAASKAAGNADFGDYTDKFVCGESQTFPENPLSSNERVVLHSYDESLRIKKVMLPRVLN